MPTDIAVPTDVVLSPFARKLSQRRWVTSDELQSILSLEVRTLARRAGGSLSEDGLRERFCVLVSGYAQLQRFSVSGKRQIQALYLPGDLIDLDVADSHHRIVTRVPSLVCYLDRADFAACIAASLNIRSAVCSEIFVQSAIYREWLFNIACREAFERLCHFLCELSQREMDAGVSNGQEFALSMTQIDIGDALGLTPVHVNRTLRRMREEGLISQGGRKLRIADRARLQHACAFDSRYLYPKAP